MLPMLVIPLTDDLRRRRERVVRAALRHADLTMRQGAQEAEMNEAHWTRLVQGIEGGLRRVYQQPDLFWQWLGVTCAAEYGIPRDVRQAVRLRRVALPLARQLKMRLRSPQKRRVG